MGGQVVEQDVIRYQGHYRWHTYGKAGSKKLP